FARRLGGSRGSGCGTPFFPRVLIRLVGLDEVVRQRRAVGGGRARARTWCRRSSRGLRLAPGSRASLAVGTPWASPRRIRRTSAGVRRVPCQGVPVNRLNTRRQSLQR